MLNKVSVRYGGRLGVEALREVSFSVDAGQFVSILGPSGCGKSTILSLAAGLLTPTSGQVLRGDFPIVRPVTSAGMVFQKPVLLDWRTALGNVMLSAQSHHMERIAAERCARQLLMTVGLGGFEEAYPRELSGGMQQRASICRALIHEPDTLLMDEPFAALDAITRDQLSVDLSNMLQERSASVLFVTHSVPEAVFLSDKVVVMTGRPGQVRKTIDIELPRPRSLHLRQTTKFGAYVEEILELFMAAGLLHDKNWKDESAKGQIAITS